MQDEFGQLSKSTDIDDTLREPDFIKKAIGLFSLRETIHSAYSRTKAEVADTHAAAGLAAAKKPGRIAFGIGLVAAAVGGVLLFSPAGIIGGFCAATIPGLIGGSVLRVMTRGFVKIGYEVERDEKIEEMKATREAMLGRVEGAINDMDNALVTQTPMVRDQFRAAFQHAALKAAIRENGIGSKVVLKTVANLEAAPSAPDPADVPDPDVTTDDPVKAMKTLKIKAPSAAVGATP